MLRLFDKLSDLLNPNRREDKRIEEEKTARLRAEQELAMKLAAEEAAKKKKKDGLNG